ncbi:MAG: alpha/beta hydrolase, partial [Planctomycetota bacterium]
MLRIISSTLKAAAARLPIRTAIHLLIVSIFVAAAPQHLVADQLVVLKSGLTLQGFLVDLPSLDKTPLANGGQGAGRPILLVDDGLKRTYVHRRGMVAKPPAEVRGFQKTIEFSQDTPLGGSEIQIIGDILSVSDFNTYGQRTITVRGAKGEVLSIVQGITEINARYAKLEALKSRPAYQWDMRVATRSIPKETLQRVFRGRVDQTDLNARLDVVRFFIDAERYRAAEEELVRAMRAFPELKDMKAQLVGIIQRQAAQLLDEAERRADAGQPEYAKRVYQNFPMNAVGRTKREEVKIAFENLLQPEIDAKSLLESLRKDVAQLPANAQTTLQGILQEIATGLDAATLPRLSDYSRLKDSQDVALDSRIALAIAGWLMGPGSGEANLTVATSLVQVRDLVAEYLGSANAVRRAEIIEALRGLEGSQPEYIARLLPLLTPVKDWPEGSADPQVEGLYRLGELAGDDEARALAEQPAYLIQLPPEYNPLREYPCIIALPPPGAAPEQELSWWAGDYVEAAGSRNGHATRNGYIVVSPLWYRPGQRFYEFTPREHAKILSAYRDAMRHASIDADRVFLAGHGEGATAAWDVALSHPEHWAGMISINGEASKTLKHYYPNTRTLPMYFVMGDSSGPSLAPLLRMGSALDNL